MVFRVVLVRKVPRVFKDFKGHKGSLVLKEARELKEARVLKELKGPLDQQVLVFHFPLVLVLTALVTHVITEIVEVHLHGTQLPPL
jgi:hypothetical protein